jgi:hypothetical protein
MIIPNGEDVVMNKDIFDQDPDLFMKFLVGSMVVQRLCCKQGDRLERTFDREFVCDILAQKSWTFDDYERILKACW